MRNPLLTTELINQVKVNTIEIETARLGRKEYYQLGKDIKRMLFNYGSPVEFEKYKFLMYCNGFNWNNTSELTLLFLAENFDVAQYIYDYKQVLAKTLDNFNIIEN